MFWAALEYNDVRNDEIVYLPNTRNFAKFYKRYFEYMSNNANKVE